MGSSRKIRTSRPPDLVTTSLRVGGKELSRSVKVINIVVERELNKIPYAKITILDGDSAKQDFAVSNQDLFVPGKELVINVGYHSDEEVIFSGIIISHSLKIRAGHTYLVIECRDKAAAMTISRKSRYFHQCTDRDMMEEIISAHGLEYDIENTMAVHDEMVQYNVTDWDFLISRTQASGKVCLVDDGKLFIMEPRLGQAPLETVSFGATMLDFDAAIDARNQFGKVTARGWDASDQKVSEVDADEYQLNAAGNLSGSELAAALGSQHINLDNGGANQLALQQWANAKNIFASFAKIRGRVKFQGISTVKPGHTIALSGVGERFSGNVFVSAIRHQVVDGNWTVDVQFGLDPKWFTENYNIAEPPAAGLLAAVRGLQVGKVVGLEGDPQGEERIQVHLPMIAHQGEGIWARIATLDAGHERGSFFLPEIDDEVIVGFINENPNNAVILGMLNSSANPAPLNASDDNNVKGFVTRSKIKMLFNDRGRSVTINTPGGRSIKLNDAENEIIIKDNDEHTITVNDDGISLHSNLDINISSMGDLTLNGNNILINAGGEFVAEGGASTTLRSGGSFTVQGAIVQIN